MPEPIKIRRALISVYDKTGIVDFARALHEGFGIEIISTGGTAKTLTEAGIPVTLVEDITGFPEMLGGRVKTLHPKIHAAILADRDNPEHMRQLKEQGIKPIDMVVVNLYPFEKTVADPNCKFEDALEMIDIGGVCLLRAAAKNQKHVLVLWTQSQYSSSLRELRDPGSTGKPLDRIRYASAAFTTTAELDQAICRFLGPPPKTDNSTLD
ncbi:MAG TPA: IMP cyclohydrolase [Phycisphaerae bacterium]|nr:IMP cyclohydrolase [Phycisphaerae bacterium]